MTNVMNFEFHRFMKESGAAMAAAKNRLRKTWITFWLSTFPNCQVEISESFARDQILQIKLSLFFCDQKIRKQIAEKMAAENKDPAATTFEDMSRPWQIFLNFLR
jgi:hypothetical protein